MIETEKKQERVLIVGVELQGMENFDMSMEELARQLGQKSSASTLKRGRSTTVRPLSALGS